MKRTQKSYIIKNISLFKQQMLQWVQPFREVVFLDSNNHKAKYTSFDAVLAFDAFTLIQTDEFNAFEKLKEYQGQINDYLFGYLSYDLKNDTENIHSLNNDHLNFPDLFFFQPKKLIFLKDSEVVFSYLGLCDDEMDLDFEKINNQEIITESKKMELVINERVSYQDYQKGFEKIQHYIHRGDIYEMNYCMEFYADNAIINPLQTYNELNIISEPPFACFGKFNHQYVISASPERYIKKQGLKIISQPIKGTAKRGSNEEEDFKLKESLAKNKKEQAENVMIVDLVRNDLSKTATKASVSVEELFGVYSFKQVHQMISTVTSTISIATNVVDVIKSTFPMGSMTGAPKLSAMKIIEEVENSKRGLYSGAVGYFTPDNDFDFNVVIRSILYNSESNYLSFSVGSAITAKANAIDEYNECLLKADAMKKVVSKC